MQKGITAGKKFAEVYEEYEKQLRSNNALDFDDLLFKTVQLFPDAEMMYWNIIKSVSVISW